MKEPKTHIIFFREYTKAIFEKLIDKFPLKTQLRAKDFIILEEEGFLYEESFCIEVFNESLNYLLNEGYIRESKRLKYSGVITEYVLTNKGLKLLRTRVIEWKQIGKII